MSPISTSRRTKPYASYSPSATTRSAIAKRASARRSAALKIQTMFRRRINAIRSQRVKNNIQRSKALLNKIRFARIAKYFPYLKITKK
jgi:ribosomal protein L35